MSRARRGISRMAPLREVEHFLNCPGELPATRLDAPTSVSAPASFIAPRQWATIAGWTASTEDDHPPYSYQRQSLFRRVGADFFTLFLLSATAR